MPVRQLKIDLQSKPVASPEDQQLILQLYSNVQNLRALNVQVFKTMMQNYMVDMISGEPVYAQSSTAIPESPSRRQQPGAQFSAISPRTILSPSFGSRVQLDFNQSEVQEKPGQQKGSPSKVPLVKSSALQNQLQLGVKQDPDEYETLTLMLQKYPEGLSLHSTGRHPNPQKISALAKKGRTQFEFEEELRLINDVFFEGILGLPGFLAWTAFPLALAHYGGEFSVQFMASELLSYGETVQQLFGNQQNTGKFVMKPRCLLQWFQDCFEGRSQEERLFNALRLPGVERISVSDWQRITQILLKLHPGLAFLQETPQFQQLYAQTVSLRILFENDTNLKGFLSQKDIKRSHLLEALWDSQYEADINRSTKCFSYEHFYIFYVSFWELDQDRDKCLNLLDLERYAGGTVVRLALKRAFDLLISIRQRQAALYAGFLPPNAPQNLQQHDIPAYLEKNQQVLFYADFVRFLLYLENPDLDAAVDFWFEVADLDGDGAISFGDFRPFYTQMREKLEAHGADVIDGQDVFCQMLDYYKAAGVAADARATSDGERELAAITLRDIRQSNARGNLFSAMFHLARFQQFDMKDPYTIRAPLQQEKTIWERFCRRKYDAQVQGIQGDGY